MATSSIIHNSWSANRRFLIVFCGVFLLIHILGFELPIWLNVGRYLHPNFDLGIYSQAIYLLDIDNLNPYLSVRHINLINHHFEPILLVAAPLANVVTPAYVGMAIEYLFILGAAGSTLYFSRRHGLCIWYGLSLALILVVNAGTTSAINIPFHPTTWAILPMTLLVFAMLKEHKFGIFASLTFLFMFKEEFPFVGVILAVAYYCKRKPGFATLLFIWTILWLVFDYMIRPPLFGIRTDFAWRIIGPLVNDPVGRLNYLLAEVDFQRLIAFSSPILPLVIIAWRKGSRPRWDILALMLPLLGIRFLGSAWRFHYLAVIVPLLFGLLGSSLEPKARDWAQPLQKAFVWVVILILITNAHPIKRNVRILAGTIGISREAVDPDRIHAIGEGMSYLLSNTRGKVLAQGNLLPLMITRPDIYQVRGPQPDEISDYRFVFVEKPPNGDPWPIEHSDYDQCIAIWRDAASTIILDNQYIFLAEGVFVDCGMETTGFNKTE